MTTNNTLCRISDPLLLLQPTERNALARALSATDIGLAGKRLTVQVVRRNDATAGFHLVADGEGLLSWAKFDEVMGALRVLGLVHWNA